MDIVLVSMPFAAPERPSAALGLISAILKEAKIDCSVCYANLLYADYAGFKLYKQASLTRPQDLVGEWLFSDQLFSETVEEANAYVADIHKQSPLLSSMDRDALYEYIKSIRLNNHEFVDLLAQKILNQKPGIVGCTSTFFQHMPSLALLKRIKELSPETVTLLGGANCEGEMGLTNHQMFPFLDFVVSGEADEIITPLVQSILNNDTPGLDIHAQSSIFAPIHRKTGYGFLPDIASSCTPGEVMNQLPVPDYSDYFKTLARIKDFHGHIIPSLPVETSRGCWWGQKKGCTFCGLNGRRKAFRPKNGGTVLSQLNELSERYGITRFQTTDNIMDKRFHKSLMPKLIESEAPYSLFFETKSGLTKKDVQEMRQAGVTWIQAGIETLDSRVLRLINKGCRAWENIRMLKFGRQYGLFIGWNFMYRFPGEEDGWYKDMAEILPLLHHLQPSPMMVPLRFDRFSPYYDDPGNFNLTLEPHKRFLQTYRFSKKIAGKMAYFFEDRNQRELDENPILRELMAGDGLVACKSAVNQWNAAYSAEKPPVLFMETTDTGCTIIDTRSCRSAKIHHLSGLEQELLDAMDEGMSHEKLWDGFCDHNDLQTVLTSLTDRKLIIRIDDVWLSLVLTTPVPLKPRIRDYPGGLFTWKNSDFSWWVDKKYNAKEKYPWI